MLKFCAAALLGAVLAFAAPLGAEAQAPAAKPLRVVTTVAMLADAVRAVGAGRVEVSSLLGEGVDPHTYRPTRADIVRLTSADLVIANGLFLEAQLDETLKTIARSRTVLLAAERIPAVRLLADEEYKDRKDPHVWMDPQLWMLVVEAIRDALIERDPAGRAGFEARAAAYVSELRKVDDYSRKVLASVPAGQRILVTAHDAFNYFGRAYGYEVEGIQGLSTESEAGLRRIEELVKLVSARGIPAVFVETSVPERNVRALVEGAAARKHRLVVGGELFSDSLGAPGTYEGTVIGMLDHNVTTIARALGGDAPARGMNGRLKAGY